jgi:hypothetical protein
MTSDELRLQARKRLEARANFWRQIGIFAAISIVMIGIWALSGMGYFWPMWPIFALVIATIFMAINAFGPGKGYISEDRVDEEVRRMTGGKDQA